MRSEMQAGLAAVETKIGAMAGAMVGVRRDARELRRDVTRVDQRVNILGMALNASIAIRAD